MSYACCCILATIGQSPIDHLQLPIAHNASRTIRKWAIRQCPSIAKPEVISSGDRHESCPLNKCSREFHLVSAFIVTVIGHQNHEPQQDTTQFRDQPSSMTEMLCMKLLYIPCPEKKGIDSILSITLTEFNTFS